MGSVMETEWSENVELLIVCSRAGSVIAKYHSLLVPFDLRVGTSSFDDGKSYLVTIDIDYAGEGSTYHSLYSRRHCCRSDQSGYNPVLPTTDRHPSLSRPDTPTS